MITKKINRVGQMSDIKWIEHLSAHLHGRAVGLAPD